MDPEYPDIGSLFLATAAAHASRPACLAEDGALSYGALRDHALRLSALLTAVAAPGSACVPVWLACSRSRSGYVGVLAALLNGCGYIPLDAAWPVERTAELLARTAAEVFICDLSTLGVLGPILARRERPSTLIFPLETPDAAQCSLLAAHRILAADDLQATSPVGASRAVGESTAFVLFTSGSTGTPKGVRVQHRAALATNAALRRRYSFSPDDRFAQMADFTWDPSIVDMLLAWACGGSVMVPSRRQAFLPDSFLRQSEATVAHMVPATLRQLDKAGRLKPGSLPGLRTVFVGGEPFPAGLARRLQAAAPQAALVNIYGAQEYSIISTCDITPELLEAHSEEAPLPMGRLLGPGDLHILDAECDGDGARTGELCVHGPQLFAGYLNDPAASAMALTRPEGEGRVYYRTGDFVKLTPTGVLSGLGRRDAQVKIAGIRIELGEIEQVLHDIAACDAALVLAWRKESMEIPRLAAFVAGGNRTEAEIVEALKRRLPSYMLPHRLVLVPEFPRTPNGKWDRQALLARCLEP